MSVLPGSKPTIGKSTALSTFGWGSFSPTTPSQKEIGKRIKNDVFLMKRVSSRKDGVLSFEKGMFPSQEGCGIEIISPATFA